MMADVLEPVVRTWSKEWWDSEEGESRRWDFSDRFRRSLGSDPRMARLKALYEQCCAQGFEPHGGFFADLDVVSTDRPLDTLRGQIQEKLSDVRRVNNSGGTGPLEQANLTDTEGSLLAELYTVFEHLAVYYVTEFALAQTDLLPGPSQRHPIELADNLISPFCWAVKDELQGVR